MQDRLENLNQKASMLLTTLKRHPNMDGAYQNTVNFSGYSSLVGTITDLMKLCILATDSEEPHISPLVGNTKIDIAAVMELALQLMSIQEAEFLDAVHDTLNCDVTEPEDWDFILATISLDPLAKFK